MELSSKVDYACIALIQLAIRHGQGQPISVNEIAHSQNIPIRYLDQVMGMLRRAGIITSQRGAKGGYHLAQEPWQIRIIDVVVALNGEDSRELQNDSQVTPEKLVIADIRELTRKGAIDVLSKHTLEDLVRKCEDKKRSDIMFYI
jgi:Rrf2 family protein